MESKVQSVCKYEGDVVIIDSDDDVSTPVLKKVRKKNSRKVSLNKINNNKETLIITQKVEVKRHTIKCVINVETNIIENVKERELTTPNVENRIRRYIPGCTRTKCRRSEKKYPYIQSKPKIRSDKEKSMKANRPYKYSSPRKHNSYNQCANHEKALEKQCIDLDDGLSSLSFSPLHNNDISYEDISADSFSSDTDLDTLIQRSKERERLTSQDSGFFHCSTPHITEDYLDTKPFEEKNKTSGLDQNIGVFVYSSSSYISDVKLDFN